MRYTYKKISVDPNFATLLKIKASENNKTIVDYTKDLGRELEQKKGKKINENFWKIL